MDTKELHKLSVAELHTRLAERTSELANARFVIASGESKHVRTVRHLRLERAQLLTELKSRERTAEQKT